MILLLLLVLVLLGGGVLGVAALTRRRAGSMGAPGTGRSAETGGQSVRRFFQYLLLTGLLVAAASGVTGLLGRLLDLGRTLVDGGGGLALQLALTVVALPLWLLLAWWTHRRAATEPAELRSLGWATYLTLVSLISLIVAMVGWYRLLTTAVGVSEFRADAIALPLVWTLVWAGHRWWARLGTPREHLLPLVLLGSVIGLATAATALVSLLGASLRILTGLSGASLIGTGTEPLLRAGALLAVGAVVWAVYWLRDALGRPRGTGWLVVVLLVGVGVGLITALGSLSVLGYDVLVWLVGDPSSTSASEHFRHTPDRVGAAVVGLLVWWYHQEVLGAGRAVARTEVRRVYEYLMAAIGLLAASSGLVMVLVTLLEAIAARSQLVVGGSALNALLAALVLLAVGTPVWAWHWRLAQRARAADPEGELASVTRRTYLLVLFGVAGVAAVVALITIVYLVLEDALEGGGLDAETIRRVRFALGILLTAGLLSAYHWTIFRSDRDESASLTATATPAAAGGWRGNVLLVGAADGTVAQEVARRTGASVQLVRRLDAEVVPWSVDDVVTAVDAAVTARDHAGVAAEGAGAGAPAAGDLIVLAERDGLRVLRVAP